jgi:hypothetical protein
MKRRQEPFPGAWRSGLSSGGLATPPPLVIDSSTLETQNVPVSSPFTPVYAPRAIALIIGYQTIIFAIHQGRGDHEIS